MTVFVAGRNDSGGLDDFCWTSRCVGTRSEGSRERDRVVQGERGAGRLLLFPRHHAESLDERLLEEAFEVIVVGVKPELGAFAQTSRSAVETARSSRVGEISGQSDACECTGEVVVRGHPSFDHPLGGVGEVAASFRERHQ